MATVSTDPDAYLRVLRAVTLVTREAIPSIDNCLRDWHTKEQTTLTPCSKLKCLGGKKPKKPLTCQECVNWGNKVESMLYSPQGPAVKAQITWQNVDPSKLGKSHVEVAKAFVLRLPGLKSASGSQQYTKLADFDSASLLMIMARFIEFHHGDQNSCDVIAKVSNIRNNLSHMPVDDNMQLETQKVAQYFQDIEAFVTCLENLHTQHFPTGVKQKLVNIQMEPITAEMRKEIQLDINQQLTEKVAGLGEQARKHAKENDGGKYVASLAEALKTHYSNTVCQKPLYPWHQDKMIDLNETFVHLTMDKEIPHTGKSIKQRLRTHDEMFKKDGTDRRLVLEGRPGLGKTTMCAKIAYDWSRGLAVGHIVLLFVLRLGLINHFTSVEEAIIEQLNIPSILCDRQQLCKTLDELGSSIVIVLDALDEADPSLFKPSQAQCSLESKWTLLCVTILVAMMAVCIKADGKIAIVCGIGTVIFAFSVTVYHVYTYYERSKLHNIVDIMKINSKGLKQCQVLVTTRPWRVAQIMKIPEYKHLELQPFIKADMEKYVKQFFTSKVLGGKLNSNYIKNNKLMVDASIPLITLLVCWYWLETKGNKKIPERRGKLYDDIIDTLCKKVKSRSEKELQDSKQAIVNGLGAIALQGLAAHRTQLVFSEKECTKYCSKEILDTACQTGIISKKGDQKGSITFFHKSAQEHLAGKYLANHQSDLKPYLGSIKTALDALTIGPVLLSAAAENIKTAEQVLEKLMEIFVKEFDDSEPQSPNEDKISISSFYNKELPVKGTRQIQQFIELCIECNYEANAKEKFTSKLVKTLFPNGNVYFFGIKPYPAVALGYLIIHIRATEESTSPVTSVQLYCAPHPCNPQVFYGPGRLAHREEMKKVKYVSSDDEVSEDVDKWKENEGRKHGDLHEDLKKLHSTEMLAYIERIQECDGLPSISDSDITPIIKSFSNPNIKLIELVMDNYRSGFDELLLQIEEGHLDSLEIMNVPRTVSSGDQTTKLANMVHKMPNIEALTIQNNKIEEGKTLPNLAQNLPNCKNLKYLSISDYKASADDMKSLFEKLPVYGYASKEYDEKFGHGLKTLQLTGNYINDDAAFIAATRLPQTLTNLGISVCGKDPQDLSLGMHNELLEALRNLPNLKKLRIYSSPYPSYLAKCVFEGIPSWNKLWGLTLCAEENEDKPPMAMPSDVCETMVESLTKYPATKKGELRLAGIYLPDGVFKRLMEVGKEKEYSRLMYPRKYVSAENENLACQKYDFVVLE